MHDDDIREPIRDPDILKRVGLEHFYGALKTGRIIAFTGSYPNEYLGYGSWGDLIKTHFDALSETADDKDKLFETIKKRTIGLKTYDSNKLDDDIGIDLAEFTLKSDRYASLNSYRGTREKTLKKFELHGFPNEDKDIYPVLFDQLRIRRAMTLNYDMELEWHCFSTTDEKTAPCTLYEIKRHSQNSKLPNLTTKEKFERKNIWKYRIRPKSRKKGNLNTTLSRYVPGRGKVTSQILIRDHSETLFEFALWSPDSETRILHMHGRMDHWKYMLLSRRDYRDLYWRSGSSRLPFEYGRRAIFAGNSALFIGIGGNEADVMRTLEQFMSNNPARIKSPHFIIWSSTMKKDGKTVDEVANAVQRLLWFRKYGIHVLFDTEIAELGGNQASYLKKIKAHEKAGSTADVAALKLTQPLKYLSEFANTRWVEDNWQEQYFRTMQPFIENGAPKHIHDTSIMQFLNSKSVKKFHSGLNVGGEDKLKNLTAPLVLLTAPPGSGKGMIAKEIACNLAKDDDNKVLLINAAFLNEAVSLFETISGAASKESAIHRRINRSAAYREFLETPRKLGEKEQLAIIVNGMERFIGQDGKALSHEFDNIVRRCVHHFDSRNNANSPPKLKLILLGTSRVYRYLTSLTKNYSHIRIESPTKQSISAQTGNALKIKALTWQHFHNQQPSLPGPVEVTLAPLPRGTPNKAAWSYFEYVKNRFEHISKTKYNTAVHIVKAPTKLSRTQKRHVFFRDILNDATLAKVGFAENPKLPIEILRTLAFVGQPVHLTTLNCSTTLRKTTEKTTSNAAKEFLKRNLAKLCDLGLVIKLPDLPSSQSSDELYGLHKAVLAEMRERYGVPITDSKLACSFNLSIFAAQSTDGYIPEEKWHRKLGDLANDLIDAFHWPSSGPSLMKSTYQVQKFSKNLLDPIKEALRKFGYCSYSDEELGYMLLPQTPARLRAALSLLRNYYSTAALLKTSSEKTDPWQNKAPLTEHCLRLQRLIRTGRDMAIVRQIAREHSPQRFKASTMGQEAFFPDDVVWLQNELGMVNLTQGKLYSASFAIHEALALNEKYVDHNEKLQNWKRISLNRVQLYIDRGNLEKAQETLRNIETAVEEHARRFGNICDADFSSKNISKTAREDIILRYARNRTGAVYNRIDRNYPDDLIFSVGLCLAYRGLCKTLQGAHEAAIDNFLDGLSIFKALRENRAYSWFQKHLASVYAELGDKQATAHALKLSVAAAGKTRQTDLDHHARVALVRHKAPDDTLMSGLSPIEKIPQLIQTLSYARNNDMFRVQSDVLHALARIHFEHGDYDSALKYAADAVAVAAKYGHGLKKVSLRTVMAQILIRRGDRKSALELLENASNIATKIGYNKAVEDIENIRVSIFERK